MTILRKILTISLACSLSLSPAIARAESACDKALATCKTVIQDYKDLQATDEEIKELLKKQRDEAISKQGASFIEKTQYVLLGAGAVAVLCLVFKCNK